MPENMTTTGYEKRITEYAAAHGHEIGRSKAQRLALKLCKRQARMTDLDLERIFVHSDPTPREAFRNIEREKSCKQQS
ncbi:hypothetical protein SEA_BRAYBEAST_38 [Arthrobacter phage BrayBeast]